MIDRLVCADGGNPDSTSTGGKDLARAKELELRGWPYPRHLAGCVFAMVVHGDAAGTESLRRILADWLTDKGLISAGAHAPLDAYIGYVGSCAESHQALDAAAAVQAETRMPLCRSSPLCACCGRASCPNPAPDCGRRVPSDGQRLKR